MSVLQQKRQLKSQLTEQKSLMKTGIPKQHNTETKSCIFVKKLMAVAISNITYLRSILPEAAFSNRSLDGLPLKILKENSGCEAATDLVNWLRGAFEALEKRYLRELMLIVYLNPENPDSIQEMYTFRFGYKSNGDTAECKLLQGTDQKPIHTVTDDDLYKATQTMLRTIIVLVQGLGPLPEAAYMTRKLTYYEDITPSDYEPKGFFPTEWTSIELSNGAVSVNSGEVSTNFHSMKLKVKAVPMNLVIRESQELKEKAAVVSNSFSVDETYPEGGNIKANQKENCGSIKNIQNNCKLNIEKTENVPNETIGLATENTIEESISLLIDKPDASHNTNCVCNNDRQDILMLMCAICQTLQHGACYRIAFESDIPETHICVRCSLKDRLICTDRKMAKIASHEAASSTFLFRRALVALLNAKTVSISYFKESLGIDDEFAQIILAKLIQDKVISQSSSGEYHVDSELLRTFSFSKYLGIKNPPSYCEGPGSHVLRPKEILKEGNNMDILIKVEMEDNKEPINIENKVTTNRFIENEINGDKENHRNGSNENNNTEDNDLILSKNLNKTLGGFETDNKRKLRRGPESKSISRKKSKYAKGKTSIVKQDRQLI